MSGRTDKPSPSHPFTMVDVEVMRAMRIRLTRRRFRIMLVLEAALSLLLLLWTAYIVASCITAKRVHTKLTSDWIILVTLLLAVANISTIIMTVRKYKAELRFLKDPATHPDLIINGELACCDALWGMPATSTHKTAP
ncbi:hypothetical protein GGI25_001296 [Coemansia spiralis]|uniref:Transmembrane protein n=2 Tax=Coemansia TaxID=4863 RepID=A0A9W8GCB7_9FUNG|nr:hypothetical protein BX070DRAFT_262284 [Coemansia spiralis]KAJ1995067.1 hypothetical protein EDC05_001158 [Coemansia umbellata]KAJ2623997.1 hypothetical protein GGI26_001790 [Coemansia sp. RSA 1358]KAJ2679606.1 hypothetical protein GGI25_001296 [Coemansia spiralis]